MKAILDHLQILCKNGGIYLDNDMILMQNFTDLLSFDNVLGELSDFAGITKSPTSTAYFPINSRIIFAASYTMLLQYLVLLITA